MNKKRYWYSKNTSSNQALIVDEITGENIAVAYNTNDGKLLASAPELLEALKHAHNSLRTFRNVPKDEQEWTSLDDETMEVIEKAIDNTESERK